MTATLTIAQVSDIHIGETAELQNNVDMRQQFLAVLTALKAYPLDLLVLSGDLALLAGEMPAYQWIKQQLIDFPVPYVIMAGNHDSVENLIEVFEVPEQDLVGYALCFSRQIKGRTLLFLDTASYRLSDSQQAWLQRQLAKTTEPVLVFMHHPPTLCDCRFMDSRYSLQNIEEVWPILAEAPNVQHIFCGHYHTGRDCEREGKQIHITPSTMLQIDTESTEFVVASRDAGWRLIEWHADGNLYTQVNYLKHSND